MRRRSLFAHSRHRPPRFGELPYGFRSRREYLRLCDLSLVSAFVTTRLFPLAGFAEALDGRFGGKRLDRVESRIRSISSRLPERSALTTSTTEEPRG